MEILSSVEGDKHEFCLAVVKFKHVRISASFVITYTYLHRVKYLRYSIWGADISNYK